MATATGTGGRYLTKFRRSHFSEGDKVMAKEVTGRVVRELTGADLALLKPSVERDWLCVATPKLGVVR